MSVLAKWTWKPDTPARVPAGARISAGKSGNVAMSLPRMADTLVNWVPASCMPSPESPANRIVTDSTSCTFRPAATVADIGGFLGFRARQGWVRGCGGSLAYAPSGASGTCPGGGWLYTAAG